MPRLRLAAALACLAWLAGCAASRPPADAPATVPPQWHAPLPHGGQLADLASWWQQFNDPLLVQLVEAAQAASPDVASATARIAQARAARVAAGAALLPSADASLSAARGNLDTGVPTSTVQLGVQSAWEIDLFGANRARAEAADERLRGAEAGWHAARVAVAAETASSYVALRTCERQLAVARNDARSRAETARLVGLSAEAGFAAPADAAQARASAADAAARVVQQQAQCEQQLKSLVAVSGLAEPELRRQLAAAWQAPAQFALPQLAPVPARLLAQRPDVHAAEREVAAASAEVGAARADRYPRLSLSGQIGVGLIRVNGDSTDAKGWSIGPLALTLPLFDGGRRAAQEEAARARYDEAVALYAARVRQAVAEVEQALVAIDAANARAQDLQVAVEGYRASFRATEARYRSGLASLIELEDQRRVLLAAETAQVALQQERLAGWIALYRAMGGGWTAPGPVAGAQP